MIRFFAAAALAATLLMPTPSAAQFTGPTASGQETSAANAQSARPGTYVTLSGNITSHLRAEYYGFRDDSGELRVEIADEVWGGRRVGPEDSVRLVGEVDRTRAGVTYVWIKSLEIVE